MTPGRTCGRADCGRPHKARGWCHTHYERWRLHGDPLWTRPTPPPPSHDEVLAECCAALAALRAVGQR